MTFSTIVTVAARIMESAGIFVMLFGVLIACVLAAAKLRASGNAFHTLRQHVGRAILLGLEFLVGADIIRTVSEIPTLEGAFVLATIVAIRTFLSFTLEVELEGRWPWQRKQSSRSDAS